MTSLYQKRIGGNTYWYLRQMARVDGKPKMVSERYVGTAADIEAMLDAREEAASPDRTRHLGFGGIAAAWGVCAELGIAGLIDEAVGPGPAGMPLSTGTYLTIAAINRLLDPRAKTGVADWWRSTAADRFTKIGVSGLDHRRFWDAMHAVDLDQLETISHRVAVQLVDVSGVDTSSVALDMTNFATFIDTGNTRAPIAQRGKAKQKRTDLRLVGLGLVVTRDGGIPLTWHAYRGDRPDVTQFPTMIDQLRDRYQQITAAAQTSTSHDDDDGDGDAVDMTVVFDAGQNSVDNFAHLAGSGLSYIGSVPASDCADLCALGADVRGVVDEDRFGALTAYDTCKRVYGADRRTILTHSPELHAAQARGFEGTTLAKVGAKLDGLAATLARGKTRRSKEKVVAEIEEITHAAWVRRVVTWRLTGEAPEELRLTWHIDTDAYHALQDELFGKHVLITDHDDWTVAEVVAGYRSQSEAESAFRQMKDTHVVSFSPMHHWTEHNIRIHTFTCVLALQIAHLIRHRAHQAGLRLSVRALLAKLAAIEETVMLYQGSRGRPKARRMLTETTNAQDQLAEVFGLHRYAPRR